MSKPSVSAIDGNRQMLDGGAMFGNAPRAVWQRWAAPDEHNRIPLACRAMLIEADGKRILCETGIGAFFEPELAERYGVETPTRHRLLESLSALQLSDADIDYVILSHLHFDHAGGLLDTYRKGEPLRLLFPNANFVVGKIALERAKSPHPRDRASFIPELPKLLAETGRLRVIDGDRIPGAFENALRFVYSEGHTPGHMHTLFKGEKHSVFFAGDLIPGTSWIHLPITMGYDRFPEKLIDEKALLYERAIQEHWLVFYTHDTTICASEIAYDEKKRVVPKNPRNGLMRVSF